MNVRAVGLMSGTSCDGVDVAMIVSDGESRIDIVAAETSAYSDLVQRRLLHIASQDVPLLEMLRIERDLTVLHAEAIATLCDRCGCPISDIQVIGFHGHTVRHVPDEGLTCQLGDASLIAELVGAPTVSDFRRRDIAAGGQGAPLAALFHAALFARAPKPLAVVNIGGVANATWLGAQGEVVAGDTGPGCGLLDRWIQRVGTQPFDRDGLVAASGQVDMATVESALSGEFFQRPFPKSADRFQFDIDVSHLSASDGAATLCAITAEAIYRAIKRLPVLPVCVWVTGGGARHPVIMKFLAERLPHVADVRRFGLRPDFLEAECFAWLAVRRLKGLATSIPTTTGAGRETCGGVITS